MDKRNGNLVALVLLGGATQLALHVTFRIGVLKEGANREVEAGRPGRSAVRDE